MVQRYSSEQWEQMLSEYRNSGMTAKEWCQSKGIKKSTLFYWMRRLKLNRVEKELNTRWTSVSISANSGSIKPFAIGRKNFLFADTVRGVKASAIIYSIIETAKENGLNPMNYLTYLFGRMPNEDFKNNPGVFEFLFPWGNLPQECYINKTNG